MLHLMLIYGYSSYVFFSIIYFQSLWNTFSFYNDGLSNWISVFISLVVFEVNLNMLTKLFILSLFYAYNMLSKIEYVGMVL